MIHGTAALAQIQHRRQRAGDVRLGPLHGRVQIIALGQVGGDGAGEGAAGAVGVGVVDPPTPEPLARTVPPEQVVGVVDLMAALAQDGAAIPLADGPGRQLHVRGIADGHAGEDLRLRDVGGQDRRQGQQLLFQNGDGVVPQKLCPGSGHHHRVHHDVLCAILAQLVRDDGDEAGRGDHADLHGIGEDVRENGVQFLTQELGRCLQNVCDAGGILGSQGRDGAHGKYAVGRHGLDVCLDAGASAGVASSDRQCCLHTDFSFSH